LIFTARFQGNNKKLQAADCCIRCRWLGRWK